MLTPQKHAELAAGMVVGPDPLPDPKANSHAGQHAGFEVFWQSQADCNKQAAEAEGALCFHEAAAILEAGEGWMWWSCQPGCLPDGCPSGPFNTSREAYDDATQDIT